MLPLCSARYEYANGFYYCIAVFSQIHTDLARYIATLVSAKPYAPRRTHVIHELTIRLVMIAPDGWGAVHGCEPLTYSIQEQQRIS